MTRLTLTRRRFLLAATAAAAMGRISPQHWEWRGSALGAEARIVLTGPKDQAQSVLAEVVAEIDRLENIFSLHRPGSQLARLNAVGTLDAPSRDLRDALQAAARWNRLTEGSFDPAVQPLWRHWAQPYQTRPAPVKSVREASVDVAAGRVTLTAGTALTLNGIAQGTIADRVASLLIRHGFTPPLIDTGEMRLPGPERREVVLPEARRAARLAEAAVATSTPAGLKFSATGRHHLFDPRSGDSPDWWRSVTVIGATAETADALSTGFAVSPPEMVGDIAATLADVAVIAVDSTGRIRTYGAPRLLTEITTA